MVKNGGITIPAEFGDLNLFKDFEEWWRHPDFGFELFCEPFMGDSIKVLSEPPEKIEEDNILLSVNLNSDKEKLEQIFSKIMRQKHVSDEYQSKARFHPSREMKNLKIDVGAKQRAKKGEVLKHNRKNKLYLARRAYELSKSMTEEQVANKLELFPYANTVKNRESAIRTVSRYKKFVRDAFKAIESGTFPDIPKK